MPKLATAGLAALFISVSSLAYVQPLAAADSKDNGPSAAELKAFTDTRIEVIKAALKLTPAQAAKWPAVEEAIRARAETRITRLVSLATQAESQQEPNPIALLRARADALSQRSAGLKKLVDAWQPLYETLDASQKLRLRFITRYVLREMGDAIANRFEDYDDYDD
jgi:hypothetical protein